MSNIKKNFFNPGALNKQGTKKAVLPSAKNDTMFNPTYQPKLSTRLVSTLNTDTSVKTKSTKYLKNGKPLKQNVGSMDRLLRLKANAMSK
jgi:hypothetical protein